MAELEALQKRYAYQEMSNKVEQADRSQLQPRSNEADGVESLWGRKSIGRMGDKLVSNESSVAGAGGAESQKRKKHRSVELEERMERAAARKKKKEGMDDDVVKSNKGREILSESGGQTILDLGRLTGYQPTHAASRSAFEGLLNTISSRDLLGSQSPSILRDAAEELLSILKNDSLRDPERQSQISYLLLGKSDALPIPTFHKFVALGKQMDDFHIKNEQEEEGEKMDDEMGVAVIFDSDEENGDDDDGNDGGEMDEVVDIAVSSDEDESDSEEENEDDPDSQNNENYNGDEEEMILQSSSTKNKRQTNDKKKQSESNFLTVHEIDAHWLQRQLSKHSENGDTKEVMDADTAAKIANEILSILEHTEDIRECENKLLVLLGFDLFSFIKILLKNRIRIWASVKMKRLAAGDDVELKKLEDSLTNESSGEGKIIWEELNFQGKAEDWTRERMEGMKERSRLEAKKISGGNKMSNAIDNIGLKGETDGNGDAMDISDDKEEAVELDLDSLKFQDGSHVMSSKKCELPSKSWRAMKKGYEEVHVPAVRAVIPKGETLVNISDMPSWTQKAFTGKYRIM